DGKSDAIHDQSAWREVGKVAELLLDGTAPRDLTNGATHYHTRAVSPSWARRFPQTAAIGSHLFYRQPVQTASN
ncbi:MAG: cell wall hydrolase, partial [Rhodobacteraceae bacterium]|nr:cell wall hydrolase [Paracoccaceae bacterium]